MSSDGQWRRCSACKKPIFLGAAYYVCSVSTCNQKRTGLAFCNVSCWEVHLPIARHRDPWAIDKVAPTRPEPQASAAPRARRRIVPKTPPSPSASTSPPAAKNADVPREILVVASRLKDYVKQRSGFNTSERVLDPLSDILREVCDEAIRNATRDERRTLLERDVPKRRGGSR